MLHNRIRITRLTFMKSAVNTNSWFVHNAKTDSTNRNTFSNVLILLFIPGCLIHSTVTTRQPNQSPEQKSNSTAVIELLNLWVLYYTTHNSYASLFKLQLLFTPKFKTLYHKHIYHCVNSMILFYYAGGVLASAV